MGDLHIFSRDDYAFHDRIEAGRMLGQKLSSMVEPGTVVLGIPRGGVIVGHELAGLIGAELDIALAGKIGAPGNPEFAIGAVAEDGSSFINRQNAATAGADDAWLIRERQRVMDEIQRRRRVFRAVREAAPLAGRTVIITDDGIATGATMQAALWAARAQGPARLLAAVPVGPEDSLAAIAKHADLTICLFAPPYFDALGRFYRSFDQVTDREVLEVLALHQPAQKGAAP